MPIIVTFTLEEAETIFRNLKNHFIQMDDQRVVYDFVHKLDHLIESEKDYISIQKSLNSENAKRDVD